MLLVTRSYHVLRSAISYTSRVTPGILQMVLSPLHLLSIPPTRAYSMRSAHCPPAPRPLSVSCSFLPCMMQFRLVCLRAFCGLLHLKYFDSSSYRVLCFHRDLLLPLSVI